MNQPFVGKEVVDKDKLTLKLAFTPSGGSRRRSSQSNAVAIDRT
jgi:hypothetical protein